jgi:hypothetical protein
MFSIYKNMGGGHTFYFIHKDISVENQRAIISYAKKQCQSNAVFVCFTDPQVSQLPLQGSWSEEIYFRLFAPYLLPDINKVLYLDGDTPPKRRIELVEEFNGGAGQVFLISLKAGGSGLNLTGADTVIHFDPWWNPAAEEQATDRAHRIGQKNTVNVIRLITRGSIEEQVVKLSQRKRELFDQMITAGEQMPTKLSQDDIRALFE